MTWSHQGYAAVGLSIPFGLGVVVSAVLFYLIRWRPRTFYRMIEAMFSIKHYEATLSDDREFIDIYGVQIGLPASTLGFLPPLALLIMATAVLTATFVLFFSELILISYYVSPNSKCPSDDEMDCYTTINGTYFFCNSSDTRIDASLGSLDEREIEGDFLVAADGGNSAVRRQFFPNHDPRIITCVSGVIAKVPVTPESEVERIIQRTPLRNGMVTVAKPGQTFFAARHILRSDQERLDEDFLWSNYRSYIYWVLNTSLADVRSIAQEQSPYKLTGDQLFDHACDLVHGFHPDVHSLIRQSDPASAV
ncbi:unnamed protein product [Rotaria sordida]|uniref:FAD-binding domain-containing protein n=2 Tax=Rotaria sordida TaxID=392033 RepID=A0A814CXM2_9BILA|nr:unnamed protein product [Rotaria sordida]CAF0948106.1 unnamed protein product [Rotaria sordida]CAF1163921.1 unnamed protein product [Rotaria sordida]CAF1336152.1 unnamed protein product [Rotaria sordida]